MDNSNPGQRHLRARAVLRGADDSLEGIIGSQIHDGAMCFVIAEQSNYRFLKGSQLHADGRFVVKPHTLDDGRWVRESGTVGFAMLCGGELRDGDFLWKSSQLVQFALNGGALIYTGAIERLAIIDATSTLGAEVLVNGERHQGCRFLKPADRISLRIPPTDVDRARDIELNAALQAILL